MVHLCKKNLTKLYDWSEKTMAIVLRLDRVMADRKISLNQLSQEVGVANVNLSKKKLVK
ncbi:DNA-binding protein [Listeria monocytogenes FSL N3-165]|nr:DNA-binding protein [Listeria monocytogenes FSL N3-165]